MGNKLSGIAKYDWRAAPRSLISKDLRPRLAALDWTLLKGSALISIGEVIARVLGFAFSLVLARAFDPSDFGEIQYAIVLAGIVAIGTQPFGQHVLARFLGKYHDSPNDQRRFLSNALLILLSVYALTLLIAVPVLTALDKMNPGVIIIFTGFTVFYAYWGMSRGFMAPVRLVIAYLGSNILHLLLIIFFVAVLGIRSTQVVLIIYGSVYLLPLILLQILSPFPLGFSRRLVNWDVIKSVLHFSWPIWLSHAAFTIYSGMDILLLEHFSNFSALGRYSLARTISLIFFFVPNGISTMLMPKIASLPKQMHRQLLINMLVLSLIVNLFILVAYLTLGEWFVQSVFGARYLSSGAIFMTLSIGMILSGSHSLITSVLVGSGRAQYETVSRFIILLITAISGWLLVPTLGGLGAAIAMTAGAISGIATYGVIALTKRRRS